MIAEQGLVTDPYFSFDISSDESVSRGIQSVLETYTVNQSSLEGSPGLLEKSTVLLLNQYGIESDIFRDPKRGLLVTAIADQWQLVSERRQGYLGDVLKAAAVGTTMFGDEVSLSSVVRNTKDAVFDPQAIDPERSRRIREYRRIIEGHVDQNLSAEAMEIASEWGPGSHLHHTRSILGVTPENEKQYDIRVLDLGERFKETFGYNAICWMLKDGTSTLVLPRDVFTPSKVRLFSHEYAHSQQGDNCRTGIDNVFFRGVLEGLVEGSVENNAAYLEQVFIMDSLIEHHPAFHELAYGWLGGDEEKERRFLSLIVEEFGLAGYLSLVSLSLGTIDDPDYYYLNGMVNEKVFVDAYDVVETLAFKNARFLEAMDRAALNNRWSARESTSALMVECTYDALSHDAPH